MTASWRSAFGVVSVVLLLAAVPLPAHGGVDDKIDGTLLYERWINDPAWMTGSADLFAIAPDGSAEHPVMEGPTSEQTPAVSPDGKRIAYVASEEGNDSGNALYVSNSDGSRVRMLLGGHGWKWWPSWSPDGTQLVFHNWNPDGSVSTIQVIGASGKGLRSIGSPGYNWAPAWSPDGKWIAFTSYSARGSNIFLMSPDGQRMKRLASGDISAFRVAWSPDGRWLAFGGWKSGSGSIGGRVFTWQDDIYLIRAGGGKLRAVTTGVEYDAYPCWSPDGKSIAFSRSLGGVYAYTGLPVPIPVYAYADSYTDLYAVDLDGSRLRQITKTPHASEYACVWSRNL